MHFLRAINSDISVLIVCNKTGGTIKVDIKKIFVDMASTGVYYLEMRHPGCVCVCNKEWVLNESKLN